MKFYLQSGQIFPDVVAQLSIQTKQNLCLQFTNSPSCPDFISSKQIVQSFFIYFFDKDFIYFYKFSSELVSGTYFIIST